jgi:hypothetical protein
MTTPPPSVEASIQTQHEALRADQEHVAALRRGLAAHAERAAEGYRQQADDLLDQSEDLLDASRRDQAHVRQQVLGLLNRTVQDLRAAQRIDRVTARHGQAAPRRVTAVGQATQQQLDTLREAQGLLQLATAEGFRALQQAQEVVAAGVDEQLQAVTDGMALVDSQLQAIVAVRQGILTDARAFAATLREQRIALRGIQHEAERHEAAHRLAVAEQEARRLIAAQEGALDPLRVNQDFGQRGAVEDATHAVEVRRLEQERQTQADRFAVEVARLRRR